MNDLFLPFFVVVNVTCHSALFPATACEGAISDLSYHAMLLFPTSETASFSSAHTPLASAPLSAAVRPWLLDVAQLPTAPHATRFGDRNSKAQVSGVDK